MPVAVPQPPPAQDQQIHVPVVVVVGLQQVDAAQQPAQSGFPGPVGKGTVPLVDEEAHLPRRVPGGNDQVQGAVVVEVVGAGAAGQIEGVQSQVGRDVEKPGERVHRTRTSRGGMR